MEFSENIQKGCRVQTYEEMIWRMNECVPWKSSKWGILNISLKYYLYFGNFQMWSICAWIDGGWLKRWGRDFHHNPRFNPFTTPNHQRQMFIVLIFSRGGWQCQAMKESHAGERCVGFGGRVLNASLFFGGYLWEPWNSISVLGPSKHVQHRYLFFCRCWAPYIPFQWVFHVY